MDFYFVKGEGNFSGWWFMLCFCPRWLWLSTPPESHGFWIQPIVRIVRRWHAFVLQNNENRSIENAISVGKLTFLLLVKFLQKFPLHLTPLKEVFLRGSDMPGQSEDRFLVGMPSTPHCPMTCFMQAPSQFEETNCASSVSIKTSVPWRSAQAALEVNWPRTVYLPSPQSGGDSAWVLKLSKLCSLWESVPFSFPPEPQAFNRVVSLSSLSPLTLFVCLNLPLRFSPFICVYLSTHNETFHTSERRAEVCCQDPTCSSRGPAPPSCPH